MILKVSLVSDVVVSFLPGANGHSQPEAVVPGWLADLFTAAALLLGLPLRRLSSRCPLIPAPQLFLTGRKMVTCLETESFSYNLCHIHKTYWNIWEFLRL